MTAKIHLRKLRDGRVFIQGFIPSLLVDEAVKFNDQVAVADIVVEKIEDRTKQFCGLSNATILSEGF